MINEKLEELLSIYDIYHSSIAKLGRVQININYYQDKIIKIILIQLLEDKEINQTTFVFQNDLEFKNKIFPKFLVRFLEKNQIINQRNIMGTEDYGTTFIERSDNKESLTIRNCEKTTMDMVNSLYEIAKNSKATSLFDVVNISSGDKNLSKYFNYNLAIDYAKYRKDFIDSIGKSNFFDFNVYKSYLDKENRNSEENLENLIILDLARYAYKMGFGFPNDDYNVWDEIEEYYDDPVIVELCENYKKLTFNDYSIYIKALICAEFEKNNEGFIMENRNIIVEALEAAKNGITYCDVGFLEYWNGKKKYYKLLGNNEFEKICNDFLDVSRLILNDKLEEKSEVSVDMEKEKKESIISRLKEVKENSRPDFSSIINDPIEIKEKISSESLFGDEDYEYIKLSAEEQAKKIIDMAKEEDDIKKAAEEQAKKIVEIIKEKEEIKKDAEEFAKTILQEQKERRKIVEAAQKQAQKLFELEKENEMLRKMAQDNARSIFETEKKYQEELRLREIKVENPVQRKDIDKINYLLNALSNVKDLDFSVNHPTVMQNIAILEEKIITYLATHKNIVEESDDNTEVTTSKEERKDPTELLSIVRNVYVNSHIYEKEGRHTVINIVPVDDKYRVTLYSVKNDSDDILTEVYFDKEIFNEKVISELCDIYSNNAVLVASKTDNIPNGLADYLVIDNQDNAIKFMECPKEVIEFAKAYL